MEFRVLSLSLAFVLISLYIFLQFHKKPNKPITPKPLKNYPILGTLPEFIKNRHRLLDWLAEILAADPKMTVRFVRPVNVFFIQTASPKNVEHILKTNFENYPKGDRLVTILGDLLGRGIFNSDGELWKAQRKTASYEFNTKSLRNFVMRNVVVEAEARLVPALSRASEAGRVVDLQDVLERFAFDNICKLAFGVDPGCLGGDATAGAEFMRAFDDATELSAGRFRYAISSLWRVKKFFNVGSERRLKDSIATIHEFADNIIRSRMEAKKENEEGEEEDLLSRFIATSENSPELLRDIVISFILAGRDTTSSALTWFFWILWSRPDVEENILKELGEIRARTGKRTGDSFGFNELRDMNYLHAAISESMRLYPPVPLDSKVCLNDDILPDGTFVGRGWTVSYHAYAMGRMEKIWGENCLEYEPERWLEEGVFRPESPFRFTAFHGGPRMCLGKDMAYIQMKSIAASVIERFEIEVMSEGKNPEQLLSLTFRMKGGLPLKQPVVDGAEAQWRTRMFVT